MIDRIFSKDSWRRAKATFLLCVIITAVGFIIPEEAVIPVEGAQFSDWNKNTYWYEPWGRSGVHKGIDIFGSKGTRLLSATPGIVLYTGDVSLGGNVVVILGPKWRIHYYAHLESIRTRPFSVHGSGDFIGTVGDSGNAVGKQAHLHYSVVSLLPLPWRIDASNQGWKKMFYLDPGVLLGDTRK